MKIALYTLYSSFLKNRPDLFFQTEAPQDKPFMNSKKQQITHKKGANRKELFHTPKKIDPNFAQSGDIYEDRGERQIKYAPKNKHKT